MTTREVDMIAPRLLDLTQAAIYLGDISVWTLRRLIAIGEIVPVRLPSVRHDGERGRRVLLDVRDLDALIETWKHTGAA